MVLKDILWPDTSNDLIYFILSIILKLIFSTIYRQLNIIKMVGNNITPYRTLHIVQNREERKLLFKKNQQNKKLKVKH